MSTGSDGYRIRLKSPVPLQALAGKPLAVKIRWRGSEQEIRFAAGGDDALRSLTPGWMPVIEDNVLTALTFVGPAAVTP